MSVRYVSIDGEKVSAEWYRVLAAMRADGVVFNVNEGHRTMARQQFFYNEYRAGRGPIAAVPSPTAPHIRTGRIDHAIDFSNDVAVFAWLKAHGLAPARTVRYPNGTVRESWHIEVSAARLRAFKAPNALGALSKNGQAKARKLLHHRREMRRLKRGAAYRRNLRWARWYKAQLAASWRVSRGAKRRTLERVLKATDGTL